MAIPEVLLLATAVSVMLYFFLLLKKLRVIATVVPAVIKRYHVFLCWVMILLAALSIATILAFIFFR